MIIISQNVRFFNKYKIILINNIFSRLVQHNDIQYGTASEKPGYIAFCMKSTFFSFFSLQLAMERVIIQVERGATRTSTVRLGL